MGAIAKFLLVLGIVLASGCASLPSLEDRTASTAQRDTAGTRLGRAIAPLARRNAAPPAAGGKGAAAGSPAKSGLYPLAGGREALAARVVLADAAERSLDIQYYIWRNDVSGMLMFNVIRRAADRGVRVRLLLDDNNTPGLDDTLQVLDSHPNIEVRLFNPFVRRKLRMIGYLTDFSRLNRRMHNKSFTADNQATIIGGRNIGDEYFDAAEERAFADLDVLAVGAVVGEVSADFDRYWSSGSAYPVDRLLPPVSEETAAGVWSALAAAEGVPAASGYSEAVQKTRFLRELFEDSLELEWAVTRMVSDDPAKVLEKSAPVASLPERFEAITGRPKRLLEMVSPYFVPMQEGVDYLVSLAREGVEIRVLTNSLAATDVVAVHAGYAKWRKRLLQAGITLHEYKPLSVTPRSPGGAAAGRGNRPPRKGDGKGEKGVSVGSAGSIGSIGSGGSGGSGSIGSSSSSLHAKTFSIDGSRVVIGSFNFDPRSIELNTELAFVIESPALARAVDEAYSRNVPQTAWQVTLTESGDLQWTGSDDGVATRYDDEPQAGFWRRAGASAISILPIDWLL